MKQVENDKLLIKLGKICKEEGVGSFMRSKLADQQTRIRSPRRGSRRSGYVLVALSLGLVFILGMAGLAVDIGRMYITKSEAQSFTDSASFSAALQLDGTSAGITRAQNAVAADPNSPWIK